VERIGEKKISTSNPIKTDKMNNLMTQSNSSAPGSKKGKNQYKTLLVILGVLLVSAGFGYAIGRLIFALSQ
jgi:hypothetical protein